MAGRRKGRGIMPRPVQTPVTLAQRAWFDPPALVHWTAWPPDAWASDPTSEQKPPTVAAAVPPILLDADATADLADDALADAEFAADEALLLAALAAAEAL